MIYWMSDEVNRIWDESPDIGLIGTICEIRDEALKGHVVIQLEIGDNFYYQLNLGDCNGLSDVEINERFVRKFPEFVDFYEKSDECIGPLVEDLRELSDKFLATIESCRQEDAK